jgi:hypothetical protein
MNFHGLAGKICGIDPYRRVANNPFLDERKPGFGEEIPYPDKIRPLTVYSQTTYSNILPARTPFSAKYCEC